MKNIMRDDNILKLSSGKSLGYAEYGNRDGIPILVQHGNPGSRLFWGLLPGSPFNEKFRLIAPDRPGYGLSDHYGYDSLKKWPEIVRELMDHLEIDSFYNCGVSGGGPYALICARDLSERIKGTALISPVGPFNEESIGDMNVNRKLWSLANKMPLIIKLQFKITTKILKNNPDNFLKLFENKVKGPDRETAGREEVKDILKIAFLEGYRHGDSGSVYDCFIPAEWPIDLSSVKGKIHIWYGEEDRSIGNMGGYMADHIAGAEKHLVRGKGHMMIFDMAGEILEHLTQSRI